MEQTTVWITDSTGEFEFKGGYGADDRLWLHCPKSNMREKSWLTEEELERNYKALQLLKAKQEMKQEAQEEQDNRNWDYEDGKTNKKNKGKKDQRWVAKKESSDDEEKKESSSDEDREQKSDGYASQRSSNNTSIMDDKEPLEYKGCTTWQEYRRLCMETGRKIDHEGKHPCYACPAPGCYWNSKRQGWDAGEHSLASHTRSSGENEEKFWKRSILGREPTPAELEKVVHPGTRWYRQVAPAEESEAEIKQRLAASGIIPKEESREKKQKVQNDAWGDGSYAE